MQNGPVGSSLVYTQNIPPFPPLTVVKVERQTRWHMPSHSSVYQPDRQTTDTFTVQGNVIRLQEEFLIVY